MDPYLGEWLNFLIRLLHVVAGIAWIGSSFYFIALDLHLLPPKNPADAARQVGGEAWEIHGGGFYRIEKFRVTPERIPEPLHWFFWEAYTTWLSGFALLIVLYYFNAELYLVDRDVLDLSAGQAIAASVAMLAIGWLAYDGLCRLLEGRDRELAAALVLVLILTTYGASLVFSARAVYIQIGAMIGTWMVANVFFVIIPGHRQLVSAKLANLDPDPIHGIRGKQRSVHNNYLTLPVLIAMLSNHYPFTYSHPHGWLVLVLLMSVAAWLRHFFNLRNQGRVHWSIPASAAAATALIAFAISPWGPFPPASAALAAAAPVEFASARKIVVERCSSCHSAQPTNPAFPVAPKNVTFDTPESIQLQAQLIFQQVYVTKVMPLGNVTGITPEERTTLAAWVRQGAKTQ
ncbi:MAG: urate hydroxylase PuuD [Chloroflexota bacterium]